jgi:hypothetical protein
VGRQSGGRAGRTAAKAGKGDCDTGKEDAGEKQFNRQVEMPAELGRLKRELSNCIGGEV